MSLLYRYQNISHFHRRTLLFIGMLIFLAAKPVMQVAWRLEAVAIEWLILLLPIVWLAFGVIACTGTAILKKLVMPSLHPAASIPLWGVDFFRWWFVQRLAGLMNPLFVCHLRGTCLLPHYLRMLVSG